MWFADDGVSRCAPLPSSNLVPFGRVAHARGTEHCRGEPGSALSGGDAPDSAKAEGSSIVDEPGGAEPFCARIKSVNREVSEGKADV